MDFTPLGLISRSFKGSALGVLSLYPLHSDSIFIFLNKNVHEKNLVTLSEYPIRRLMYMNKFHKHFNKFFGNAFLDHVTHTESKVCTSNVELLCNFYRYLIYLLKS